MARLPVSVGAMIPESGVAPITTEVGVQPGEDVISPTSLVLRYLTSRGFQPSTENVRRVLEANARDPSLIPELRGSTGLGPASGGGSSGARGGGAYQPSGTGGAGDTTPILPNPNQGPSTPPDRRTGDVTTSAAPPAANQPPAPVVNNPPPVVTQPPPVVPPDTEVPPAVRSSVDTSAIPIPGGQLGASILMGIPALGAAAYGMDRFIQNRGGAAVGNPPVPEVGVGGTRLTPDPALAPPPPDTIFPGAATQVTPPPSAVPPAVIDKAVAPAGVTDLNPVARPGSLDMTPPRGPVEPVAPVVPFRSNPATRGAVMEPSLATRGSRLLRRLPK